MSNEINKRVERIRTFFRKVQPQNHPIKNHPVAKCDEYVKGLYFDMLCVMAMYENDDTENQNRFIQRLMAGSGDTLSITDHIKRAMEITTDKVNELIVQVKNNSLTEILFIDSLIISCANGLPNRKQTEFLAELGDMLGLNKASIEFCSELAVGILEQDFDKIQECAGRYINVEHITSSADCYIKSVVERSFLVNEDISLDPKTIHYYSNTRTDTPIFKGEKDLKKYDSVVAENITFKSRVNFTSIPKVRLVSCVFKNNSDGALYFKGVEKVEIENCIFSDLSYVFSFDSTGIRFTIKNSEFNECRNSKRSAIFYSNGAIIKFESCRFKNNSSASDYGIVSYNNDITANNCEFYNCSSGIAIFEGGSLSETNNKYVGCTTVKC